jgi:hypothetical protein
MGEHLFLGNLHHIILNTLHSNSCCKKMTPKDAQEGKKVISKTLNWQLEYSNKGFDFNV